MATLLSGYTEKPESSPESATPQHLESTEPKNIHQVLEKTTSNVLAKPSALNVADTALETTETAHTIASNPRHDANTELNINSHNDEADSSDADSSLPPVDTGKDAWLFLLSAFILNVLVWSMSFSSHTCVPIVGANTVRFPIRLWHLPGVLLLASAIQGPAKHCHCGYLRLGIDVSLFAVGL